MRSASQHSLVFVSGKDSGLAIWEKPVKGVRYTLGLDAATGLYTDFTVMQVVTNTMPFTQVARFRNKIGANRATDLAYDLGTYYNTAMMVCEINYPGNSVQDGLLKMGYPRNYQPEDTLDDDPHISSKFGYLTTEAKKWLLIREMLELLKNKEVVFNDITTIDEFASFIFIEDRGKTGAMQGLNDDCVIAMLLACHGAKLWPQAPMVDRSVEDKRLLKTTDDERQIRAIMERFNQRIVQRGGQLEGAIAI